jgi:hypothetical protein
MPGVEGAGRRNTEGGAGAVVDTESNPTVGVQEAGEKMTYGKTAY